MLDCQWSKGAHKTHRGTKSEVVHKLKMHKLTEGIFEWE